MPSRPAPSVGTQFHLCVFKSSHHHPHGRLTFCFLFAGQRCLCPGWHSVLVIVQHHWQRQHSFFCECSHSKSPIAPMGRSLTCPNRLSSFNWDRSLVLPGICMCHPHLQTSHRPDGKIADVLALILACTTATDASVN